MARQHIAILPATINHQLYHEILLHCGVRLRIALNISCHLSDAPILHQFGLSTRFKKCSELSLQDAPFATTRLGA